VVRRDAVLADHEGDGTLRSDVRLSPDRSHVQAGTASSNSKKMLPQGESGIAES
jgi:hypothetical protein